MYGIVGTHPAKSKGKLENEAVGPEFLIVLRMEKLSFKGGRDQENPKVGCSRDIAFAQRNQRMDFLSGFASFPSFPRKREPKAGTFWV